jgi:hypothetical protein
VSHNSLKVETKIRTRVSQIQVIQRYRFTRFTLESSKPNRHLLIRVYILSILLQGRAIYIAILWNLLFITERVTRTSVFYVVVTTQYLIFVAGGISWPASHNTTVQARTTPKLQSLIFHNMFRVVRLRH